MVRLSLVDLGDDVWVVRLVDGSGVRADVLYLQALDAAGDVIFERRDSGPVRSFRVGVWDDDGVAYPLGVAAPYSHGRRMEGV